MPKHPASIRATVRVARTMLFLALASTAGWAQICIERSQDLPIPAPTWALEMVDVDGDLDLDLVVVEYGSSTVSILRNLGNGTFASRVPWGAGFFPFEVDGVNLNGDGDLDWAVADAFSLPTGAASRVIVLWNDGTGAYPTITSLAALRSPRTLVAVDLDLDGDADLAMANWGGNLSVYENLGAGVFALPIVTPLEAYTVGLRAADLDGDGDDDLAAVQDGQGAELWRNCGISGVPYCFGDGSATACPCGNTSPPVARAGCRNSTGLDPTLRAAGSARLAHDELVLSGAGMPNASVLYFQGTSAIPGGAVFGDGLRCAGGTVVRLGLVSNLANMSSYPGPSDPPVSVRGGVSSVGSRMVQAWFRDAAAFCTSATFGLTNGVRVVWQP